MCWGCTVASGSWLPWPHVRQAFHQIVLQPDFQSCCSLDGYVRPCCLAACHAAATQVFRHLVVEAQGQQLCNCGCLAGALSSGALGRLPLLSSSWGHCRHTSCLEQQARPATVSATRDCRHRGLSQQGTSLRCKAHSLWQQQTRVIMTLARNLQVCLLTSDYTSRQPCLADYGQ